MSGKPNGIMIAYRLVRGTNLLVVAATMYILKFLVFEQWLLNELTAKTGIALSKDQILDQSDYYELNFALLVTSTVLIAAAGNIINDYFDIRADRVNRPNQIIIGKYVKRRWAIILNWVLTATGMLIAAYLAYYYRSLWLIIIPALSSFFLWIYSVYLKRKLLIGNVIIAGLTSLVLILPAHFLLLENKIIGGFKSLEIDWEPAIFLTGLLTVFAFVTNFTREIVKDLHDVEGDKKLGCETIPLVMGKRFTRIIIGALLFLQLFFFVLLLAAGSRKVDAVGASRTFAVILLIGLIGAYLVSFVTNITAKTRKQHYLISHLLKVIMLLGLLFPFVTLL